MWLVLGYFTHTVERNCRQKRTMEGLNMLPKKEISLSTDKKRELKENESEGGTEGGKEGKSELVGEWKELNIAND